MKWNWKSWPYWVRGGSIALTLPVLLYLLAAGVRFYIPTVTMSLVGIPLLLIGGIVEKIVGCTVGKGILAVPGLSSCSVPLEFWINGVTILIIAACYFAIGSLIGYLYGKSKNRKQLST